MFLGSLEVLHTMITVEMCHGTAQAFTIIDQIAYFGIIRQSNEINFIQGVLTTLS